MSNENENESVFRIDGMTCGACVRHVRRALESVDGVGSVDVDLREGVARVVHTSAIEVSAMVGAVARAGYDATRVR